MSDVELLRAAERGATETIAARLAQGADPNAAERFQRTALTLAASQGHTEAVRLLLDHGADPNLVNPIGETPLGRAVEYGPVSTARLLLDRGAQVNQTDAYGWTALERAAAYSNVAAAELLLQRGAGRTPYGLAALKKAIHSGSGAMVSVLLAGGCANAVDTPERCRLLLQTVKRGITDVARALLDGGFDINATTPEQGWTPLLQAAADGREEMVRLLIERGANVQAQDAQGRTALSVAAARRNIVAEAMLRAAGEPG